MIKILAVGNSFSEDATKYLSCLTRAAGIDAKIVNLYIGGCSLETHANNIREDACGYEYQPGGINTGVNYSVKEGLLEEEWDFVTMQQASHDSGWEETYFPHMQALSDYIAEYAPSARQLIHQTWAYELDSDHWAFERYEKDQQKMYDQLEAAYLQAADILTLDIIPCGKVVQTLRKLPEFDYPNGGLSLCRDGFHMSYIYGRYAVAATWYETLIGADIRENPYLPPKADAHLIHIIQQTVHEICGE